MKKSNRHNSSRAYARLRRRLGLWVAALAGVVAVITVATAWWSTGQDGARQSATVLAGEAGGLPSFAYTSDATLAGYRAAVANQDLFKQMPCYCGCGMHSIAHHNLKECFIRPDGAFESHAAGCRICVDIALDVMKWQGEGQSTREIRQNVDATYSRYGPSTDTPPVTGG